MMVWFITFGGFFLYILIGFCFLKLAIRIDENYLNWPGGWDYLPATLMEATFLTIFFWPYLSVIFFGKKIIFHYIPWLNNNPIPNDNVQENVQEDVVEEIIPVKDRFDLLDL